METKKPLLLPYLSIRYSWVIAGFRPALWCIFTCIHVYIMYRKKLYVRWESLGSNLWCLLTWKMVDHERCMFPYIAVLSMVQRGWPGRTFSFIDDMLFAWELYLQSLYRKFDDLMQFFCQLAFRPSTGLPNVIHHLINDNILLSLLTPTPNIILACGSAGGRGRVLPCSKAILRSAWDRGRDRLEELTFCIVNLWARPLRFCIQLRVQGSRLHGNRSPFPPQLRSLLLILCSIHYQALRNQAFRNQAFPLLFCYLYLEAVPTLHGFLPLCLLRKPTGLFLPERVSVSLHEMVTPLGPIILPFLNRIVPLLPEILICIKSPRLA